MKSTSTAGRAPSKLVTATVCAVAAVLMFTFDSALKKWLAADYSIWQIMLFRGLAGALPIFGYALIFAGSTAVRSKQPGLQLLRAGFGLGANLLFILAYREMPLAEAVAIGYAAPIFIVVLSVPLLSERVGVQRASAAVVGFLGVLLVAQPGAGLFSAGALYALGATLFYALLIIATRRLGSSDGALCTVLHTSGIYGLASALVVPFVWITPDAADLGLLVLVGLVGSAGTLLFAHAYRHAPAALLAPLDYSGLLWAGLIGFIIWQEVPGVAAVLGMIVIAGSGLFLIRYARLHRSPV